MPQKKHKPYLTAAEQQAQEELAYGNRVVLITIIINLGLTLFKLAAGILGHSAAMVSDAAHSAADLFISLFVLLGLRVARRNADEGHPYGHEKLESVVSIVMTLLLAIVALGIGNGAIKSLFNSSKLAAPNVLALSAAIVSIVAKEWMYHYTLRAGRRIKSPTMEADAWHHRSDAFSSIGSLIGIGGAMLGVRILDPIAALIICLLILKVAFGLGKSALNQLVDSAAPPQVIEHIEKLIAEDEEIIRLDDLKTRQHGSKIYVDVEISVSHLLSLTHAHDIAEKLHDKIERSNNAIKHCMVHVNPCEMQSEKPYT